MFQPYPLHLYLKHRAVRTVLILSLILNALTWVWLFTHVHVKQDSFFIHYNILFGVDQIGSLVDLLLIPVFALVIALVNAGLGWLVFSKDKIMAHLLNTIGFLVQIFTLMAIALLMALNA